MTDFPPEPWELRGQLHASVFRVPLAAFPPGELDSIPPGWSLVQVRGHAVVGAAWVVYEPGGVLDYRELMATVLIRRGVKMAPHIVRIWVDSEASLAGGRALWAIPKELADFDISVGGRQTRYAARESAGPIAVAAIRGGLRLPGRWPIAFSVAQARSGRALVSPVRSRAGLSVGRAKWIAEPFGPLGFINGRRPLATFLLRDFRMQFGSLSTDRAERRAPAGTT